MLLLCQIFHLSNTLVCDQTPAKLQHKLSIVFIKFSLPELLAGLQTLYLVDDDLFESLLPRYVQSGRFWHFYTAVSCQLSASMQQSNVDCCPGSGAGHIWPDVTSLVPQVYSFNTNACWWYEGLFLVAVMSHAKISYFCSKVGQSTEQMDWWELVTSALFVLFWTLSLSWCFILSLLFLSILSFSFPLLSLSYPSTGFINYACVKGLTSTSCWGP